MPEHTYPDITRPSIAGNTITTRPRYDMGTKTQPQPDAGVTPRLPAHALRASAPPSLRRKAREWGVVYDGEEEAPAPPAPPTP